MWTFVLTLGLLCWGSEAVVSCKNNLDASVDWYIIYKTPRSQQLTGLDYIYMDSTGVIETTPNNKGINHPDGILANTLKPLFTSIRMSPDFGFIIYNDQPPRSEGAIGFGHSKGVLLVDSGGTGVWLLHSTPRFPWQRDKYNFWPVTGTKNGQTFICITLPYGEFKHVGKHLQYIGALTFDYGIPAHFHQELIDAVSGIQLPAPNNFQQLTTSGDNIFRSIAKQTSPQPRDGDLYVTIGRLINSNVFAQTWGCQRGHDCSYCEENQPHVYHVEEITTVLGDWKSTHDHSKWCVAEDQNRNWICIADVNRAPSQYIRKGGALCFESQTIKAQFRNFVKKYENCPSQVSTDSCDGSIFCLLPFISQFFA